MSVIKNSKCEFCGKTRPLLANTSFHGFYCDKCLRLERADAMLGLHEIKDEQNNKKKEVTS